MTDDLTRGLEGRQDTSAESTEITYTSGRDGSATVVGQAAEVANVSRPAPGQTVEIQAAAGQTYNLDFPPAGAQIQIDNGDFVLSFDDGAQIVFSDMVAVIDSGDAPTFTLAGTEVGADVLLTQALALAGQADVTLETAAGPDALGTGATQYSDNFNELITLLFPEGVIPPVELEFVLIELEDDPFAFAPSEEIAQSTPLINEIGVAVTLTVPELPSEPDDEVAEEAAAALADDPKHEDEPEPQEVNFIELLNTDGGAFDVSGMTLEILNPAGEVVTFVMPGGTVLPPNGFVVLYQAAEDPEEDGETVYLRIFDAEGNVVGGVDVAGADFWDLGDDTTDPIAVNLVDGGESLDTFAANLTQDDLAGLTDPDFAGTPADFVSPLLDLNLETFNGQFTDNHHIFSRVNSSDTDSQNDWTTNNIPTDGGLNTTGLPGGPFAYTITDANVLLVIDLADGTTYEVGALFDGDGVLSGDFEGLTFGQGADAGFLFAYDDDGDNRIVKIDPATGEVVEQWDLNDPIVNGLGTPGLTVAADGKFYAVGNNQGIYEVVFGAGTFTVAEVAVAAEFGSFNVAGLAADPNDPNLLYAIGEDAGTVRLFTIAADTGVVTELAGVIGLASNDQMGLAFDAEGNLWAIDEDNDLAYQVDPATGALIAGSEIDLPPGLSYESIAILLDGVPDLVDANPWDPLNDDLNPEQNNPDPLAGQNFLQAADGGDTVEGFGGPDFIQGAAGDDGLYGGSQDLVEQQAQKIADQFEQLEGAGVPVLGEGTQDGHDAELVHQPFFSDHNDFLFGDAGDDQMYGGSGGDYMIGGEGDDSMDGGTGDDRIFGDGSEEIGGLPEEGEGAGEEGAVQHGDDVLAGDALNNLDSLLGGDDAGPGAEEVPQGIEAILEGYEGAAAAILGGNDTIDAGKGDDIASGDALATGAESVYALGYADNSFLRPENGVASDGALVQNDEEGGDLGSIFLVDALGNVEVAISADDITGLTGLGDVTFRETGIDIDAEGTIYFLESSSNAVFRKTEFGEVELIASEADIEAALGGGVNPDPEGLVVGPDGFIYITEDTTDSVLKIDPADGTVTVLTTAADVEALGGITGFGVEGGILVSADGESLYVTSSGTPEAIIRIDLETGTPEVVASGAPFSNIDGYMVLAPNGDIIVADQGSNSLHRVTPDGAVTEFLSNAQLNAAFGGAVDLEGGIWFDSDGNFYVTDENSDFIVKFGSVDPWTGEVDPAGELLLTDVQVQNAIASNVDYEGGAVLVPGGGAFPTDTGFANDVIDGGEGDDALAGDSAAIAVADEDSEEATEAKAVAINNAVYSDGVAMDQSKAATGNDIIDGGEGDNRIAGEAQAIADDAEAVAQNTAAGGEEIEAGNDKIKAHDGDDQISGDAQALGRDNAVSKAFNTVADGDESSAGNDYIVAGEGDNEVAGDSQAISEDGDASAIGENTADDGSSEDENQAGNDTIFGSLAGDDALSGDAQAIAGTIATAQSTNSALGDGNASGNDHIEAGEGRNKTAGDAQAIASVEAWAYGTNTAGSGNLDRDNNAGNDTIATGDEADSVSGGAQALAGAYAFAQQINDAGVGIGAGNENGNAAGNDDIDVGEGHNRAAGDAQAISHDGTAEAYGENEAGDGGSADGNNAGNDTIYAGDQSDSLSGGAQAIGKVHAYADQLNEAGTGDLDDDNRAGNDEIHAFDGKNKVAGDAQALGTGFLSTAEAMSKNHADSEDNLDGADNQAGNDTINAGDDSDSVSGGAQAIAAKFTKATSINTALGEGNIAGDDDIDAGEGHNRVAGDAQAISFGVAEAYSENTASAEGEGSNEAGNDTVESGSGHDTVSGDAQAIAKVYALSKSANLALDDEDNAAGNDSIEAGDGDNVLAGDSQAIATHGLAEAFGENTANDENDASAGNDTIRSGSDRDIISGGAMAVAAALAFAQQVNAAEQGSAGNDDIDSDVGGNDEDEVAGDAMARSQGWGFSDAVAESANTANGSGSFAGLDIIDAGGNSNHVAGEAMAVNTGDDAEATAANTATDGGYAGNDSIVSGVSADIVSGGTQARAEDDAIARTDNRATGDNSEAGNDTIEAGQGNNQVAGDAQAISEDDAWAYGSNIAGDGNEDSGNRSGNDSITTGNQTDTVSGGAQALANDDAFAEQINRAGAGGDDEVGNYAGNDELNVGDGFNRVAGDSQAISYNDDASAYGENEAGNDGSADGNHAGNDTIVAGENSDRISGGAQAIANDDAYASQENDAGTGDRDDDNRAGNDSITAGDGTNRVAGDAQALAGGDATALSDNHADSTDTDLDNTADNQSGDDTITAGGGNDRMSGDAQAIANGDATATATNTALGEGNLAGNDHITAGNGLNELAGDAQADSAENNANAQTFNEANGVNNVAGVDVILGGADADIIAGGSLATGVTGSADTDNNALNGGVAGDDTINAGGGDDTVSGDSGSLLIEGGTATTNNIATTDGAAGNDKIIAGDGNNVVAGDALETAENGARAYANNTATAVGSQALGADAGNDVGLAGADSDDMGGDALVKGDAGLAQATNTASGGPGHAGDDSLFSYEGDDEVAGDAAAFGNGSVSLAKNTADSGGGWAGNDKIFLGSGEDWAAGDAGSFGIGSGDATAENLADAIDGAWGNSFAGNDTIFADGEDEVERIAGDALAAGIAATALAKNTATALAGDDDAEAGNDLITSDNGGSPNDQGGGDGIDFIGGDALATAEDGVATVENSASADGDPFSDAAAGNDTIRADGDINFIAGDAASTALDGGNATVTNTAVSAGPDDGAAVNMASAGNDTIGTRLEPFTDGISIETDFIAGEALTLGAGTLAQAVNSGTASDQAFAIVGNDTIESGDDSDLVSGAALAIASDAEAFADNDGTGSDQAVVSVDNDIIDGGLDDDFLAGEALVAGANATATVENTGIGEDDATVDVGTDFIDGGDGFGWISGDAMATGNDGEAEVTNSAEANDNAAVEVGNDTITASGSFQQVIAGDALAIGQNGNATVTNSFVNAAAAAMAIVGSDLIETADGNDLISGDAMATDGGNATVFNDPAGETNAQVSNDTIISGAGNDTIAGDALSDGGTAQVNTGGDDSIIAGIGNDLIAGDVLAIGGGTAELNQAGGNDTIDGGAGDDIIYGDSSDVDAAIGGDDSILGGIGEDLIYGGAGDDFIDGGAGDDSLFGGTGDDTLVFDPLDTVIDGGDGTDTVLITSDTDLTGNTSLNDIEIIDMTDGDTIDDVFLTAADVISMTDGDNVLQILGDDNGAPDDDVHLEGGGWVFGGTIGGFEIYTNGGATVQIQDGLDVFT
ncbi:hypothetical protein [Pelagibius sp.]|uniref:hypothetical protein n=1 Tax=Pelagibius sp. TaxID=1931238 RepID=UPI003B5040F6